MDILMKHFGNALGEIRSQKGLTKDELAELTKLNIETINILERGEGEIAPEDKKKFALLVYSLLMQ